MPAVPKSSKEGGRDLSPMSVVSSASLGVLDRLSPACSTTSLERFLSTPMEEEGVSIAFVKWALQSNVQEEHDLSTWRIASRAAPRSLSSVNSGSSISSINSFQSRDSHVSTDSRGSRRGRKQWRRLSTRHVLRGDSQRSSEHSPAISPRMHSTSKLSPQRDTPIAPLLELGVAVETSDTHSNEFQLKPASEGTDMCSDKRHLFCTWPSCTSRFRYRFDLTRHEEALHYCPFHWVCCRMDDQPQDVLGCLVCRESDHTAAQHCNSCATKDLRVRTFLREDQLAQHIKRAHIHPAIPKKQISKDLLSLWKVNNPSFPVEYLRCGFCGLVSTSWAQRQDHVFDHLRKGIQKSLWQVGRCAEAPRAAITYVYKFSLQIIS
jgi:hypothetical protein